MDFIQDGINTENVTLFILFVTALILFAGLIPPFINIILKFKDRNKIEFIIERFKEPTNKPVDSDWRIRILRPNRHIQKCIVLYNKERLPWVDNDHTYYERRILSNGGGNFLVPKAIQKEGAEIKIQNGNKTLKKIKFEDLPVTKP